MGETDDDSFGDVRLALVERLLDFDGGDLLAVALDHVLEAVLEPQNAVRIEITDIARVEPPVSKDLRRGGIVAQILGQRLGASINDLAGLALREQAAGLVHDADLHVRSRRADRTGISELVFRSISPLLLFITDVHSLGLKVAQGLMFTEAFYWDFDDGTRAFSKRFADRMKSKAMPTMGQASVASSILHYLKNLDALGGNPQDGAKSSRR